MSSLTGLTGAMDRRRDDDDDGHDVAEVTPVAADEAPTEVINVAWLREKISGDSAGSSDDAEVRPESKVRHSVRTLDPAEQRRAKEKRKLTRMKWVTEIVATLLMVVALFGFWQLYYSDVQAGRVQDDVSASLRDRWAANPQEAAAEVVAGETGSTGIDAFGYLHIPRFGAGWNQAILVGTSQAALAAGPGHYEGSQLPGEIGNMALAGHRDGHGAPFHDNDKFQVCDPLVVETATQWLVYRVLPTGIPASEAYIDAIHACAPWEVASRLSDPAYNGLSGSKITTPTDVDVVAPVPGHPEISQADAKVPLLTLTTCHPIWSNAERLITHAVLAETFDKSDHPANWVPAVVAVR